MTDTDDVVLEPEDDGAEEAADKKLKKLRAELAKAQKERDEYLAGWQRSKADYINLARRVREGDEAKTRQSVAHVARNVIAVLDSLEAARKNSAEDSTVTEALTPIRCQLEDALRGLGVSTFTPRAGELFDPILHEPIKTVATEAKNEDNAISETLQSGYLMDGAVIRPARVSVMRYQPAQ